MGVIFNGLDKPDKWQIRDGKKKTGIQWFTRGKWKIVKPALSWETYRKIVMAEREFKEGDWPKKKL